MKNKMKNAMNILHIADIHFGKKNDQKLYNDLKANFINEIPNIIKNYGHINMIIIEGDLFDRVIKMTESSSNYVLKFISELCELTTKYNFYLRLIQGTKSHDNNQLNNFNHLEVKYPMFKIFKTVNSESIEYNDYEYNILYLPEEYPEDYKKYYYSWMNHEENYDFIFGHGMMDFVSYTGDDETKRKLKHNEAVHSVDKLNLLCNYFCIFGHIHDMQNYLNKDKIMYVGSFERFSFADQEDKGFLLTRVDPETDETEVIFYENKDASIYKILNMEDYEFEDTESKIKFIENEKKSCDYLKIILNDEEDNKDLLKNVIADDVKVETHNKLPEDKVDERFMFLIKNDLPIDKSIEKYIKITTGENVSHQTINKLISKTAEGD